MARADDLAPLLERGRAAALRFGSITAWNAGTGVGDVALGDGGVITSPAWITPPVAYAVGAQVALLQVDGRWLILGRVTVP